MVIYENVCREQEAISVDEELEAICFAIILRDEQNTRGTFYTSPPGLDGVVNELSLVHTVWVTDGE